jgi:uncharacterized membrane protein YdjX (TVP38/TMEM64 family)
MSSRNKILLVCAVIAGLAALLMVCASRLPTGAFKDFINAMGFWAPAGFVAIFTIATTFGAPTSILSAMGGVIFGGAFGTALAIISVTLGATGSFLFTRYYAKEFVTRKFGGSPWFVKLNEGLNKSGLYFVMFVRVVPVFPFNGTNFAAGVTSVSFRDYFFGTLLGVIPANIIFANAASQAMEAVAGGGLDYGAILWLSLLGALVLFTAVYKTRGAESVNT